SYVILNLDGVERSATLENCHPEAGLWPRDLTSPSISMALRGVRRWRVVIPRPVFGERSYVIVNLDCVESSATPVDGVPDAGFGKVPPVLSLCRAWASSGSGRTRATVRGLLGRQKQKGEPQGSARCRPDFLSLPVAHSTPFPALPHPASLRRALRA